MSTTPATLPNAPRPRTRRRWWRVALVLVALVGAGAAGLVLYTHVTTANAWAEAVAEADRLDPGWRLAQLEEVRPVIPDAENAGLHASAVVRLGKGFGISGVPQYGEIFEKLTPERELNVQQIQLVRGELAKFPKAIEEARRLKDLPRGRLRVTYSDDFISTLLPEHQNVRQIGDWLQHDAMLLAQDGQSDAAVESCQAMLNAGQVFVGDPFLIAHLIHVAIESMAVRALERALAQGEVSEERLQLLQAHLEKVLQSNGWLAAVRGERAGAHHLFDNFRSGKIKGLSMRGLGINRGGEPGFFTPVLDWAADTFPSTLLTYYPAHLRQMNECVEIAKLPIHERKARYKEVEQKVDRTANPVQLLFAPAFRKVHLAECRGQSLLRSALVACACERYRLKHQDWPESLDALVRAKLLTAVPTDPSDGQPLRYRRKAHLVAIYSVGADGVDNGGQLGSPQPDEPGNDIGFRLWDHSARRAAPLPPVALPELGANAPGDD